MTIHRSFCRFCHAFCGIEVEVKDGRALSVRGDRDNPMSEGYTCIKGRALPEQHHHPERVLRHQRRNPTGGLEPIAFDSLVEEVGDTLARIVAEHGPRSVALYGGTAAYQNAAGLPVARAFMHGLGSPSFYSSLTIDQPAKLIAPQHHGSFMSGTHPFERADVWMVFGCNSIVSMYGGVSGFPSFNPTKRVKEAKRRGLKLIVADPRRSELARLADLYLPVRPGEDPTLVAGMLRLILEEGLFDAAFCDRFVEGLAELREAVRPFDLDYVSKRTGVDAELIEQAARLFARGPRGAASSGTGPSMSPRPNLAEHLIMDLNTVCGRYNRAGEEMRNPSTLLPARAFVEDATSPIPGYKTGAQSRIRGLGSVAGELPCAALAEEILTPGEGRVRALIVLGGNPAVAFPDFERTRRALESLELLVAVEPFPSATARLAHYVVAPTLSLERADTTALMDTWYPEAFAMYTAPVLERPGEVVEEWEFIHALARHLGVQIPLAGGVLDLERKPSTDELLDSINHFARVPLDEVRRHASGALFPPGEPVRVLPGPAEPSGRLRVAPPELRDELAEVRAEPLVDGGGYRGGEAFTHRLVCRRLREACNSVGPQLPSLRAKRPYNPAFMHPDDLASLGLQPGETARVRSAHGEILAVVEAAADVRRGVVSMSHSWGGPDEDAATVRECGSCTARLIDVTCDFDPISGIPMQSAIPVVVLRLETGGEGGGEIGGGAT